MGKHDIIYWAKMRKNILLYMPPNKRTVALETVILETAKHHNIRLLTLAERGDLHLFLESKGIVCETMEVNESNPIIRIIKHTAKLVQYCRKNEIDTLWSHLHPCNLYAVLAQFFIPSKTIIFRHHFHAQIKETGMKGLNRNELWMEKIISLLAKKIVVPSSEVYNGMIIYEGIDSRKIDIIPYIYNFDHYAHPNIEEVLRIQTEFPCQLRILMAMRMIKLKRHLLVLPAINRLIMEGYDIQILLLDEGEEKPSIMQFIQENNLENRIHCLGFQKNIIDFISACDLVLHPSATEASSSLIKEAGYLSKTVIACKDVGDFSDYIDHQVNGFLLNPGEECEGTYKCVKAILNKGIDTSAFGNSLKSVILQKYAVNDYSISKYLDL
jgi:glycosyltransferase involved in cell wall biosynthesis